MRPSNRTQVDPRPRAPRILAMACIACACGDVNVDPRDPPPGGGDPDGGTPVESDYSIAVAPARLFIRQGETQTIDVSITRTGDFDEAITIEPADLPDGVTAEPINVAGGEQTATMTFTAADEATQGALDLELSATADDEIRSATMRLVVAGQPGTLDQSFADGGKLAFQVGGAPAFGIGHFIQADGAILVTGGSSNQIVTARLREDGTLDDTFATGGIVSTGVGESSSGAVIVTTPDGRILVGGSGGTVEGRDMVLARYTSNGDLDTTFGSSGVVRTEYGIDSADVEQIVILPTGEILAAGVQFIVTSGANLQVNRYTADGAQVDFNIERTGVTPRAARLDREGRLLLAGQEFSNFLVARFLDDGYGDNTFSTGGIATIDIKDGSGDSAHGLIDLPNGMLLLAGTSNTADGSFVSFARFNINGTPDLNFGEAGAILTDVPFTMRAPDVVRVDAERRILLGGTTNTPDATPAVARFLPDGTPDPTWGTAGVVPIEFALGSTTVDAANGLSIDPDGRILISGRAGAPDNQHLVMARLWP
jgi:uncharacterized delta-60 repeat protein